MPIAICTANAAKRRLTKIDFVEIRWKADCTIRAPRNQKASESVMFVFDVMIATANKPPKIGRLSTQLAWHVLVVA
jgi:hypothetical protein